MASETSTVIILMWTLIGGLICDEVSEHIPVPLASASCLHQLLDMAPYIRIRCPVLVILVPPGTLLSQSQIFF